MRRLVYRTLFLVATCVLTPVRAQTPCDLLPPPMVRPSEWSFLSGADSQLHPLKSVPVVGIPGLPDIDTPADPLALRPALDVWADAVPLLTSSLRPRSQELWTDKAFR